MKKLVTIILAIAMIFAMTVTAFAADTANLTIDGEGRTYVGYKLLNLTTSHKTNATCDGNHNKDCYNYAYTVANDDYRAILQNEVFEYGETTATAAADITDDQIIKYLADQKDGGDYGELRAVADRLYTEIKDKGLGADQAAFDGNANIAQGYWLFADVTNLDGQNKANSFVMVDTMGEINLEIDPKTALPTIKKEVYDVNDTTGEGEWKDSADHDITDDVEFKLTATLADNFAYYDTYKLVFHDDLADGFTLDVTSIVVTAKNGDTPVDITGKYVITYPQHCDFEVTFADVTDIAGVTKDTVFEVTYKAELNENAVVGKAGNVNEVTLEYSNDPYSDSTGEASDDVKVYTYELVINKVDEENEPLTGAEFTLSKKNAQGGYDVIATVEKNAEGTQFTWTGLDDGDYKLEETVVPAGYNKMTDVEFTISAEHTKDTVTLNSSIGEIDQDAGVITDEIVNRTGSILPETGAMGTFVLISVGSMLVILAAVFMITRKKMSVYED